MPSVAGLRILVTGATSGIGLGTATELAARGATVIVHGRDRARVAAQVAQTIERGGKAIAAVADLRSLSATVRLADAVARTGPLDVLINNAGVGFGADPSRRETSADGFELRFAVNYLAPFVLAHELLVRGRLRRAIVNLASIGQQDLDFEDLDSEHSYHGVTAYRRSKLALIMATFDLAAAHPGLGCVALHPGTLLDTAMVRDAGIAPRGPTARGVASVLNAVERALDGVTGVYLDEQQPARALAQAYDVEARRKLHEATLAYVEPFLGLASPVRIVDLWQEAASAGDLAQTLALSAVDIEVAGPRGSARGHEAVRDWLSRTGIRLVPRRHFGHASTIVVEQLATWTTGAPAPSTIASVFDVRGGRVTRVARHDRLADALADAGLTEAEEI
jgi:NAD(P)-dependent dehydrogenase (short-subunit alcohol dehydrogenase family)